VWVANYIHYSHVDYFDFKSRSSEFLSSFIYIDQLILEFICLLRHISAVIGIQINYETILLMTVLLLLLLLLPSMLQQLSIRNEVGGR